jgi:hypothetical protein
MRRDEISKVCNEVTIDHTLRLGSTASCCDRAVQGDFIEIDEPKIRVIQGGKLCLQCRCYNLYMYIL